MRNLETIKKIVDYNKAHVYITYVNLDGFPETRAMLSPRIIEGLKYFYFTTNTSSNKVKAYLKNDKGSIYFVDKRFFRGVSLSGTVEVLTNQEIKNEIWQVGDEKFYQEGVTDPDYCVLKFTINRGRYYYSFKNIDFEVE